jgi:hypothetical protein
LKHGAQAGLADQQVIAVAVKQLQAVVVVDMPVLQYRLVLVKSIQYVLAVEQNLSMVWFAKQVHLAQDQFQVADVQAD